MVTLRHEALNYTVRISLGKAKNIYSHKQLSNSGESVQLESEKRSLVLSINK